jgi:hypothetical protein
MSIAYRHDPAEASFIGLMAAEDCRLIGSYRLVGQRTVQPVQLEDGDTDYAY